MYLTLCYLRHVTIFLILDFIFLFFFNSFLYCLLLACLELCSQIGAFPFALVLSAGTPDSIYLWIHAVCPPHLFFFFFHNCSHLFVPFPCHLGVFLKPISI